MKYDHGFYTAASLAAAKGLNPDKQAQLLNPHAATVILDLALTGRENMICGANQLDYHLRNVSVARDITATLTEDIRNVSENEPDPIDGSPLRLGKAVEVGHIFKLGDRYTQSMGARVLNAAGKEVTPIMGCYGIGVERILTAAIEQSAAKSADSASPTYALPPSIAPFTVVVTVTNVREEPLVLGGDKSPRPLKTPASTSSSTTATNAPASNSRTPTSSASPSASPSANASPTASSSSPIASAASQSTSPPPRSPPISPPASQTAT